MLKKSLSRVPWQFFAKTSLPFCANASDNVEGYVVPRAEVKSFIERCMVSVGTRRSHAEALADNLACADYRGHFSHGLNRIGEVTRFVICVIT